MGVRTRNISQARMVAGVMQASLPPVIARSTIPALIICIATPMAWLAEEQALVTVKHGPVILWAMLTCEIAELGINRGIENGSTLGSPE